MPKVTDLAQIFQGTVPKELLPSLLKARDWFSIFVAEAIVTGAAGLSWRQRLEGEVTEDDWLAVASEPRKAELVSLAGFAHSPDGKLEVPLEISTKQLILPDTTTDDDVKKIVEQLTLLVEVHAL